MTTAIALSGVLLLLQQAQKNLPKHKLLVVYPFLEKTAQGFAITPQGLALADRLTAQLRLRDPAAVYPLSVESIFALANFDSLRVPEYLSRLANAAGAQAFGVGVYGEHNNSKAFQAKFQLFEAQKSEPLLEHSLTVSAEAVNELSGKILSSLGVEDAREASPRSAQQRNEDYYALLLRFLRHENIVAEIARLARRDTTDNALAELSARATLQHLRESRAPEAQWQDSLKVMLPRLQRVLRHDSLRVAPYLLLGQCYLQQKKWNEAEKMLRRARALDQRESKSFIYFAQLHASRYQQDGFDNELELFERALALNPFDVEAVVGAAEYLFRNNRVPDAKALLAKYQQINPNNLAVLMTLGRFYISQGDAQNVMTTYERIIQLDSKDANAFYNLGIAYYNHKDFDHALQFFERAIKLADHADARMYLAHIHEQRGEMDKSVAYLRERIRLSAGDDDVFAAEARKHLYKILLKRGEIPKHLQPDSLQKN